MGGDRGGWQPVGPATEPFADNYPTPRAAILDEIAAIVAAFAPRLAARSTPAST